MSDDGRFSDVPRGTISILTQSGPVHLGKSVASSQFLPTELTFFLPMTPLLSWISLERILASSNVDVVMYN